MERKYINLICQLCSLLLLMVLSACSVDTLFQDGSRQITVSATMPGSGDYVNSTRVSFTQSEGSSNLVARWQEGDQIQLYVKQDKKVYTLAPTKVQNISQDGKSCTFAFQLPSAVDAERPYTIYGLHDIEGAIADDVVLAKSQLRRVYWNNGDKALAPMWFQSTGGASSIYAQFKHLGTYEVLHLKNTSKVEVMFSHCGFDVDVPWYKVYENTPLDENYDPTQYVTEPGDANSTAYFVGPGTTARILSWYMPSGGLLTNAKLLAAIDNKQVTSSNSKSSKVQLQRGHAYHMYATWDGKELKFDQGDALWGELQLSTYSVQIPVGGDVEIQILNGSKQKANLKFDIPDGVVTGPIFTGDASFKLHANKVGHTSVTVTDEAEKLRAVIEVEVKDLVPDTPADAIDLGLPSGTLWASYNVGATKPDEFGDKYAWGETEVKEEYTEENYLYNGKNLGSNICGTEYDVAHVKWGGNWQMPTRKQIEELIEKCSHEECEQNGVPGMLFTGKNGNSIFLPFTEEFEDWEGYTEQWGDYWSGTLYSVDNSNSYELLIRNSGRASCIYSSRERGKSIRPVDVSLWEPPTLIITPENEMIDFGVVFDGTDKKKSFSVKNTGNSNVTIYVDADNGFAKFFEVSDNMKQITLSPGASKNYTVTAHGIPAGYSASTNVFIKMVGSDDVEKVNVSSSGNDYGPLVSKTTITLAVGEKESVSVKPSGVNNIEFDVEGIVDAIGGGPGESVLWDEVHDSRAGSHVFGITFTALKVGVVHVTFMDSSTNQTEVLTITVTDS